MFEKADPCAEAAQGNKEIQYRPFPVFCPLFYQRHVPGSGAHAVRGEDEPEEKRLFSLASYTMGIPPRGRGDLPVGSGAGDV